MVYDFVRGEWRLTTAIAIRFTKHFSPDRAEPGLILRSIAKRCVSKDEMPPILRDALLRTAPQDEADQR
jgi:hypothetical protein